MGTRVVFLNIEYGYIWFLPINLQDYWGKRYKLWIVSSTCCMRAMLAHGHGYVLKHNTIDIYMRLWGSTLYKAGSYKCFQSVLIVWWWRRAGVRCYCRRNTSTTLKRQTGSLVVQIVLHCTVHCNRCCNDRTLHCIASQSEVRGGDVVRKRKRKKLHSAWSLLLLQTSLKVLR